MALTRAQLISGNIADGAILANNPQGVRSGGAGIDIALNGVISVNSQTTVGLMKLGQTVPSAAAAFNGYTWPIGPGAAGQQLETDGAGNLSWAAAAGIPWTTKGQLVVGTGPNTDILLSVGTDTAFLVTDSTTASGLAYTDNVTTAALLPVGNNTTQRPATPVVGQIRYNSTDGEFEGYGGSPASWQPFGSGTVTTVSGTAPISVATPTTTPVISIAAATTAATGAVQLADAAASQAGTSATLVSTPAFTVSKDAATMTGAALLPSGTSGQQPGTPVAGMTRYNTTTGDLEFYTGSAWNGVTAKVLGAGAGATYDVGASQLPVGTNAERPATPLAGMTRFNTSSAPDSLEVYDGTAAVWRQVAYVPDLGTLPDLIPTNGSVLPASGTYENIIINAGVTVTAPGICQLKARTSIQINGTVNVNTAWPGAGAQGISSGAGVAAIGSQIGQGIGQFGRIYGYSGTLSGTGGGAATIIIDTGSGNGSAGGNGGGGLVLICGGPITVGAAGVITASGSVALPGAATGGTLGVQIPGGGGGSGGLIYLESDSNVTLAGTSILDVSGGDGRVGFAGGSRTAFGAGGGGGGGGGYIILSSPNTTSVPANFDVSGGAAGADFAGAPVGDPAYFGNYGGSFAGSGGNPGGGVSGAWALPGGPGLVLYNVYL